MQKNSKTFRHIFEFSLYEDHDTYSEDMSGEIRMYVKPYIVQNKNSTNSLKTDYVNYLFFFFFYTEV